MIVVSDTSAITNLLQVEAEHLLGQLFGRVLIPPVIEAELRRFHAWLPAPGTFLDAQPAPAY